MNGIIGIILICFGLRSLLKFNNKRKQLNKSRIWADSVIDYLKEEISKTVYK